MMQLGWALLGVVLLASAALSFELAREHMAALGVICGTDQAPHCGWCYASVAFLLSGVSALIAAVRPQAQARRA